MIDELRKLRELTETLTGNGYLRDQAEEWEFALDAIPEPIYIVNPNFQIKFVNHVLAERLGVSKEDCIDQVCYSFIWGYDEETLPESWRDVDCVKGKPELRDQWIKKLNGWFDVSRSPIYTRAEKFIGFICVMQETTATKAALEALQRREMTLRAIFNSAPIAMGLVRRGDRTLLSVNQTMLDMLGYDEDELVGKHASILYPTEEESERVGEIKYKTFDTKGFGDLETVWICKDGTEKDIYLKSSRIGDDDEAVFTGIDITGRKETERIIKLNEERLSSSLILSAMDHKDESAVIEYALEEAVRLTGSKIGYVHFVNNPNEDLAKVNLSLFRWSNAVHEQCSASPTPHYPLIEAGCWADCIRTKLPAIHNNYVMMDKSEGAKGLPEGHVPIYRHLSVPVLEDDKVVAVIGVGNKDSDYDETDIKQLSLFANSMWDIVKRKRAEDEALKSKRYFERIISSSPVGVLVYNLVDGELILRHFNPAAEQILNMDSSEHIGKKIYEVFPGLKDKDIVEDFKNIAFNGGKLRVEAYEYECGKSMCYYVVNAFRSDTGEVAVFFVDVTEKFLNEEKIKDSEEKFKAIFDVNKDVITVLRLGDGVIVDVNPAFELYTGISRDQIVGKTVLDIEAWVNMEDREKFYEDILKDGKVEDMKVQFKMREGEYVDAILSSAIIKIDGVAHAVSIIREDK